MALGDVVVVPVVSPTSSVELARLAATLAVPDGGKVVALTVVGLDADEARAAAAQELVDQAAAAARATGATAEGVVASDRSVVSAVLSCMAAEGATLALMGWQGASTQQNVFGELIDSIVGRSTIPLAVVRIRPEPFTDVVLPFSADHLLPGGARGLQLAADIAGRMRGPEATVTILRTGESEETLPDEVRALGDRVQHDRRRVDQAVGAAAKAGDIVVVPVAATASGLRTATTHMAWAAPDPWLLIAVDVGPAAPGGGIADAVAGAGTEPLRGEADDDAGDYGIAITARPDDETSPVDVAHLVAALRLVGVVDDPSEGVGPDGRPWHRMTVTVTAPSANVAVGAVLDAVHSSDALLGAEITYDVSG